MRINCAAIPETLLESELFGYERGAFTGAVKQKAGLVEEANGGTIFLDEIADMSRPLQAKLLRFLEDGSFTRAWSGTQELRVNVRLIAATNRDIVQAIKESNFREDLYHRLNVVKFLLPPLRERDDDVPLLAEHFLKQFGATMNKRVKSLSPAAARKLLSHHWPGNVRQMETSSKARLDSRTRGGNPAGKLAGFPGGSEVAEISRAENDGLRVAGRPRDLFRAAVDCGHSRTQRFQFGQISQSN